VRDVSQKVFWLHHNPVRILAGLDSLSRLPELVPHGKLLLVTTPGSTRRGLTARVQSLLGISRVFVYDHITPNPELDELDAATAGLRDKEIRSIIALGGGSALDAGKVLSVTLPCDTISPLDHVLRKGNSHVWQTSLPLVAIPTTAGTGSEGTPFATVWDRPTAKKYSVAGESVFPCHAILDPELTLTLPHRETLYTALDAFSHALESLWNKNRTPVSQALAIEALKLANQTLPVILQFPQSVEHRAQMQQASLLAGLAISQTRTAIAHSISYPLTVHYGVPHGLACAFTLPAILGMEDIRSKMPDYFTEYLDRSKATMEKLSMKSEVKKFIKLREAKLLISEMYLPGRADNMNIQINSAALANILESSMS